MFHINALECTPHVINNSNMSTLLCIDTLVFSGSNTWAVKCQCSDMTSPVLSIIYSLFSVICIVFFITKQCSSF